jgi:hypothetical protein
MQVTISTRVGSVTIALVTHVEALGALSAAAFGRVPLAGRKASTIMPAVIQGLAGIAPLSKCNHPTLISPGAPGPMSRRF